MPSHPNVDTPGEAYHCFLTQVSPNDKPWDTHKSTAEKVSQFYQQIGYKRYSERITGCAKWLEFALKAREKGEFNLKLFSTWFCRVRHCPVCQWRRSLMWRARFFKALPKLVNDYPTARFLFLTLTVRNCPVEELRETLGWMNQGWKRMIERKVWPALGFVRSTEVTRNTNDCTAHPHFHCLLMVPSSYFVGRVYLSQEKWTDLWQSCLRIEYSPRVDVRAVKPKPGVEGTADKALFISICETLKYTVKEQDLVANAEWLGELTRQLFKMKLIATGGVLKEYISEEEPENLIDGDLEEDEITDEDIKLVFDWSSIVKRYTKRQ